MNPPGRDAAAAAVLRLETDGAPGIRFDCGGSSYELPRPLPVKFWVWLFMSIREESDAADDHEWFLLEVTAKAESAVLRLAGLAEEQFRSVGAEEHQRVCDALVRQIGGELDLARPFSPATQALAAIRRVGLLGKAMRAGDGSPQSSSSSATPAEATGKQ